MCMYPKRSEEGARSFGTGVTAAANYSSWVLRLIFGSYERAAVILKY